MSAMQNRGGAAVGYLTDLDPLEARAVQVLRLWCDSQEGQQQVWTDLAVNLGPQRARSALKSIETLFDLCMRHARRPLIRHQVSCTCLGADESCFAHFVGYAMQGDLEDALMMASTLVSPSVAPLLVGAAQEVGFSLQRLTLGAFTPPDPNLAQPNRLH